MDGIEPDEEKKPKAKSPPSETMVVPGESGLPGTSRSSDAPNGRNRMIRTAAEQVRDDQSIRRCCQKNCSAAAVCDSGNVLVQATIMQRLCKYSRLVPKLIFQLSTSIFIAALKNHILQGVDVTSSSSAREGSTRGLQRFQFAPRQYNPTGKNTAPRQYDLTGNNMLPIWVPWLTTKWCEISRHKQVSSCITGHV